MTGGSKATGGTSATNTNAGGNTAITGGTSSAGGSSATAGSTSTGPQHWVGTWAASPYVDSNSNNTPPISLSNSVIRQVTHVSLGGSQIRVQFSNLWGNGSLVINGAHIALCKATPKVDSTIDTTTDKALSFSGAATVTIAQGKEVWSDPIDFTVPNQGNITITTSFGNVPSTLTQHSGSRTTSYFKSGGTTADLTAANMSSATTKALWFFISGIDVMADASAGGVVAFGDSITDGRGTDNDMNNRWTDILAARLQGNAATAQVSMMNQAIGATNVYGTGNTNGQKRYAHDVLGMSGAKYVVVLYGVNDIHGNVSLANITGAYKDLVDRAHSHDPKILVFGGTLLPFGGNTSGSDPYYSSTAESLRKDVNNAIKANAMGFDGIIDFDAALTDNGTPPKLQDVYAAWTAGNPSGSADGLHPGPAGYKKMGETPDLTLFTK
jgi:lysophospholipase L1-like esterase